MNVPYISQTIQQLEKEILRGQSFQGPLVAREIYTKLKERGRLDRYDYVGCPHYGLNKFLKIFSVCAMTEM